MGPGRKPRRSVFSERGSIYTFLCNVQQHSYFAFIACPGTLKDVQCESWGFRYAECPVNEADVILNAVVAKKDSVSQCAYQGAGTAPANYPENMATLGLLAHMNNVLWVHSGCRAKVSVCHTGSSVSIKYIRRFFLFLGLRILRPKFLHFRKKLKFYF